MATTQQPEQPGTGSGTAVATTISQKGIRALLEHESARMRIEPFLPPGADLARVIAGVNYAARQNPKILECTPHSIIDAVARIQQWQLEIGITAHLVPFNTNIGTKERPQWATICTPIADYKGLAELMVRSKAVRHVEARVVYAKDDFTYELGLNAKLEHRPTAAKDRGAITHAYCILRLPFGASSFEVMPVEDIEAIRQKNSKQWKSGPLPAWYAKKTVVRQAAKLVPKDPRYAQALQVIESDEDEEFRGAEIPAAATFAQLGTGDVGEETPAETAQMAIPAIAPPMRRQDYGDAETRAQRLDAVVPPTQADPYGIREPGEEPPEAHVVTSVEEPPPDDDDGDLWVAEQDAEREREQSARRGRSR